MKAKKEVYQISKNNLYELKNYKVPQETVLVVFRVLLIFMGQKSYDWKSIV